jgi:hypothetical protein
VDGRARFGGLQRWEAIVLGLSMAAMLGWSVGRRAPRSGVIAVNVEPADASVLVDGVKEVRLGRAEELLPALFPSR